MDGRLADEKDHVVTDACLFLGKEPSDATPSRHVVRLFPRGLIQRGKQQAAGGPDFFPFLR
jgi:hypothetical protein